MALTNLWPGFGQWVPWAVIIWITIGPESLATVLRNRGQQIIPPSRAQVMTIPVSVIDEHCALVDALCIGTLLVSLARLSSLPYRDAGPRNVDWRRPHRGWHSAFID